MTPSSNPLTLVVLAAGMGSRYGGLKQLDPMGPDGETVLDYSVFDAIRAGFDRVVFVIRRDFETEFRDAVGTRFENRITLDYAFQELSDVSPNFEVPSHRQKPWGTAHAVRAAREIINGPFAVINADDFYGADAFNRAANFLRNSTPDAIPSRYALVGYPLLNTLSEHGEVNRGICQSDSHGNLKKVEEILNIRRESDARVRGTATNGERIELTESDPVSMNFWCFSGDFMKFAEREFATFLNERGAEEKSEIYIPSVVDFLIRSGEVSCEVLPTTSQWFGVTYPDDKPHVVSSIRALIANGEYPQKLS